MVLVVMVTWGPRYGHRLPHFWKRHHWNVVKKLCMAPSHARLTPWKMSLSPPSYGGVGCCDVDAWFSSASIWEVVDHSDCLVVVFLVAWCKSILFLYLLLLDLVKVREKVAEPHVGMLVLEWTTKQVQIEDFCSNEDPSTLKSNSENNRSSNEFFERDW